MSTTSLKLPDDMKQLAAAAARRQGVTPHAFMPFVPQPQMQSGGRNSLPMPVSCR
jgi:hypothetical protein